MLANFLDDLSDAIALAGSSGTSVKREASLPVGASALAAFACPWHRRDIAAAPTAFDRWVIKWLSVLTESVVPRGRQIRRIQNGLFVERFSHSISPLQSDSRRWRMMRHVHLRVAHQVVLEQARPKTVRPDGRPSDADPRHPRCREAQVSSRGMTLPSR